MSDPVVVDHVTKRFAGHTAVDSLSLTVPSGIIYGLLGPNGAGKTTTIRMLMDIYEPDEGSVRVLGTSAGGRAHSERPGCLPGEGGLDPVNTQVLQDTIIDYRRRGKTVLFSTHIMEHAEKLCDRLCIIARGRKLIDDSLTEVKRTHGGKHVIVVFDGSQGGAQQLFGDRRLVAKVQDFGQQAELELADGADPQEILRGLVNSGARLSRFELASPSLH